MKYLFLILTTLLIACSGSSPQKNTPSVTGTWKLISLESIDNSKQVKPLTDCDAQTLWQFTEEKVEPLNDGTEVMKVIAKAPDNCKWFGFESKWTMQGEKLFISSTQVGGMGGSSNAGLFNMTMPESGKMVLQILHLKYTFEKQE